MYKFSFTLAALTLMTASIPAAAANGGLLTPQPMDQRSDMPVMYEQQPVVVQRETIVVRETPFYGQQIVNALQYRDDAANFRALLAANGISKTLRDNRNGYTAFVPLNEAFSKHNITVPASLHRTAAVNSRMRAMLESHIVDKKYDVNLMHGNRDGLEAINGEAITISRAGNNFYVNGKQIVGRQHDPEGIIYFTQDLITTPGFSAAVLNPMDVRK